MTDLSVIESIFAAALDQPSPGGRAAYLDAACPDPQVRQHVERLLAAHPRVGSFLNASPTVDFEPIAERVGSTIGPYKLMEQIGEGGMGLVFVAEQSEPVRRKVAVKVIKPGMDSRDVIARFEAERQALALMDHPNIARVLDAGTTESGRPYFVMELVKGLPIIEYCDRQRVSARERLELFVTVCQAVQHAHAKGIIHRDLKPSNILVAPYDAVPVVKVIDFGVAKAVGQQLTDKTIYTRFQQMIGTPLYMSPEQAEINALDVDIRSDVYSLGVLLYELLTGTTPFDRQRFATAAYDEIRRIIKEEEPPKPSTRLSTLGAALTEVSLQRKIEPAKLSSLVRGDLDWIVMKALEKDRGRRYETASAFAADVRHFLAEEPVEARPPSAVYRLRKFANRHRAAVFVGSALLSLVMLGLLGTGLGLIHARREAFRARRALMEAEVQRVEATRAGNQAAAEKNNAVAAKEGLRRSLYSSDLQLAHAAWKSGSILGMRALLDEHRPQPGEADLRGFEWNYLRRLGAGFRVLKPLPAVIGGWLSPDGERLALSEYVPAQSRAVGREFRLRLWDTASGQELRGFSPFPGESAVTHLLGGRDTPFSSDGKRFAFRAAIRDVAGRLRWRLKIWDWDTGRELFQWPESRDSSLHPDSLISPTLDATGRRFAAAIRRPGVEGKFDLKVWEVDAGKELWTIPITAIDSRGFSFRCLAFSPDGACLAALVRPDGPEVPSDSREVQIFEAETGKELRRFATGTGSLLAYSPDGSRLAVAGGGPTGVWDARLGKELFQLKEEEEEFEDPNESIAFSPDGSSLAKGSWDGKVRIWDIGTIGPGGNRAPARIFEESSVRLAEVAWGPDGRSIGASDGGGRYLRWEVTTPEKRDPMRGLVDGRFSPTSSDGSPRYCAGFRDESNPLSDDIELRVWDQTGKILFTAKDATLKTPGQFGRGRRKLKLSRSGDRVVYCASNPGAIRVWEIATGRQIFRRDCEGGSQGGESFYDGIAFSPDGRRLASIWVGKRNPDDTRNSFVCVWDLASGKEELRMKARSEVLDSGLCFSPDGRRLAATFRGVQREFLESELRVWDTATGELVISRAWPSLFIAPPCYSADGTLLATALADSQVPGVVKVLDAASGKEKLSLAGHRGQVYGLTFSPDGRRLASAGYLRNESEVKLWDVAGGRDLLTLLAIGHGNLKFHPDGFHLSYVSRTMAFGDAEVNVQVWDATPLPEDRSDPLARP